jgi:hypothetical protein
MIIYLLNQFCLICFNLVNSRIDAYRILKHKTIAHAVNLSAYAAFSIALYYFTVKPVVSWCNFPYLDFSIFCFSAFTNRQFSFDIPLNLRRHLPFDHVTKAKPPKAWLDRQEIRIFGYNGRAPLVFYGIIWIACLIIKFYV